MKEQRKKGTRETRDKRDKGDRQRERGRKPLITPGDPHWALGSFSFYTLYFENVYHQYTLHSFI